MAASQVTETESTLVISMRLDAVTVQRVDGMAEKEQRSRANLLVVFINEALAARDRREKRAKK